MSLSDILVSNTTLEEVSWANVNLNTVNANTINTPTVDASNVSVDTLSVSQNAEIGSLYLNPVGFGPLFYNTAAGSTITGSETLNAVTLFLGIVIANPSSGITLTLPTPASVSTYITSTYNQTILSGMSFSFLFINASSSGAVAFASNGAFSVNGLTSGSGGVVPINSQRVMTCVNTGTNTWVLYF